MINYEQHIYEIETAGFTIVENVFNEPTISALKKYLDKALVDDQKMFSCYPRKKSELAVDLTIHDPFFIQCIDNDIILELCGRLLGKNCILYSYTSTILRPAVSSAVHDMHVDSAKFIPNYLTGIVMTVALDDFTDENGATLYLPGSQNMEIKPDEKTFAKYAQTTARKAGDVLFFNPRVWHKAGNNITNKVRYGITLYATRSFFKQRFDFPRMIPAEFLEGLSPRVLSFLGYSAKVPDSVASYYS